MHVQGCNFLNVFLKTLEYLDVNIWQLMLSAEDAANVLSGSMTLQQARVRTFCIEHTESI